MLISSNKQCKIYQADNFRMKKKLDKVHNRQRNKSSQKIINCSREMKHEHARNFHILGQKKSLKNLDENLDSIENNNFLFNSTDETSSPNFQSNVNKNVRSSKIHYKTPNVMPLDQIVIINNNEYKEKLVPPAYKIRQINRNPEKRGKPKVIGKSSKSEERTRNDNINRNQNKTQMLV